MSSPRRRPMIDLTPYIPTAIIAASTGGMTYGIMKAQGVETRENVKALSATVAAQAAEIAASSTRISVVENQVRTQGDAIFEALRDLKQGGSETRQEIRSIRDALLAGARQG